MARWKFDYILTSRGLLLGTAVFTCEWIQTSQWLRNQWSSFIISKFEWITWFFVYRSSTWSWDHPLQTITTSDPRKERSMDWIITRTDSDLTLPLNWDLKLGYLDCISLDRYNCIIKAVLNLWRGYLSDLSTLGKNLEVIFLWHVSA